MKKKVVILADIEEDNVKESLLYEDGDSLSVVLFFLVSSFSQKAVP